ncbi:putative protein YneK [Escherichia coli]
MDLTQLEMFNAVAEAGSITQAAAKVHRVPSNLTTRLRQLETELGVDLFIRENQRLRLSPAGHNFLRYSQQILALVDEARSVVAGDEPQGLFSLGSLESTAAVRIPATLAEFNRRYPKIQFSLSTGPSGTMLDGVLEGKLNAAFIDGPINHTAIDGIPVYREELMIVTPQGYAPVTRADDFPVRNIAPQVKEVLKDFIDALSTIICNEEWRTSLNINSATKKIFNNLDNLSYIQRTSFRGNDTLYNEKVQFKLTYPARNGRHKENIEFQVVINLSPIYLDNFRHDGEINIFCAPNPKPVTMGRVFQTGVERVLFLFLNDFIEQFPMINPGVPIKRAHTPHIEPLPSDHHTAADYLRQFDLLVLNFISRGNFVILPRLWNNSEVHRWFVNKDPNLITAILDITDSELKEDLLQSLMDSLGSNKHVLPEVCICFLSLLAEQESPHFQNLFLFFANMLLHYHQFMNPNESDLNDVLMPASLSDDKIIKHMARRTLKLFVKNETPPKVTHEDLVKNRPRSPVRPPIPATAKTPDLPERH